MKAVLIRLAVNGAALWVAAAVVGGIELNEGNERGPGGRAIDSELGQQLLVLLIVAAIFAAVNTVVKPIVKMLSLPLFFLTLGLIIFVINALMLLLTSAISDGLDVPFHVDGFGAALLGGLVISFVSFLINVVLPDELEAK